MRAAHPRCSRRRDLCAPSVACRRNWPWRRAWRVASAPVTAASYPPARATCACASMVQSSTRPCSMSWRSMEEHACEGGEVLLFAKGCPARARVHARGAPSRECIHPRSRLLRDSLSRPARFRRGERHEMTVEFCGLDLAHPVINGSGTFDAIAARRAFGDALDRDFPFAAFGSKTITLAPRAGNPPPRLWEAQAGLINSIGLPNKGLDA